MDSTLCEDHKNSAKISITENDYARVTQKFKMMSSHILKNGELPCKNVIFSVFASSKDCKLV